MRTASTTFHACLLVLVFASFAATVTADEISLSEIDRQIVREPNYKSKPRYVLIVIGADAKSSFWIVQDDDRLYIDKNGNRDLTDDGPPVVATKKRSLGPGRWDRDFVLDAWKLGERTIADEFCMHHWNYADPEDQYGLSLTVEGKIPMYAGWSPMLALSPNEAQVIHFGGPVVPRMLRYKEFELGSQPTRFSIAFATPRDSKLGTALLSTEAIDAGVKPKAVIDWPVEDGIEPLVTTHVLNERCCYWEYYTTTFQIPKRAIPGKAKVTVIVPAEHFPLEMTSDHFEVPVVRKKS